MADGSMRRKEQAVGDGFHGANRFRLCALLSYSLYIGLKSVSKGTWHPRHSLCILCMLLLRVVDLGEKKQNQIGVCVQGSLCFAKLLSLILMYFDPVSLLQRLNRTPFPTQAVST